MTVSRVYIHYPFCASYCRYCNFSAGAPPKEEFTSPYVEALMAEAAAEDHHLSPILDSLYFGGGTPSLMEEGPLRQIFTFYEKRLSPHTEITLEINPETVTRSKAKLWKSLGITRVSLGWQSMDNCTLQTLNRSGRAEDNMQGFLLLREAGFQNISVDRILSVRGDKAEPFYKALQELKPEHLSTYQLSIEERTVLHHWTSIGAYLPLSDKDALIQEEECKNIAHELGYERYEISNYARGGLIGQHNKAYWDFDYYLGLGAGASGFLPLGSCGTRTANPFSFRDYLKGIPAEREELSPLTAVKEALMVGLRKREGIPKKSFEKRHNVMWDHLFSAPPDAQFFSDDGAALILKEEAIPLCNPATLDLWAKINESSLPF